MKFDKKLEAYKLAIENMSKEERLKELVKISKKNYNLSSGASLFFGYGNGLVLTVCIHDLMEEFGVDFPFAIVPCTAALFSTLVSLHYSLRESSLAKKEEIIYRYIDSDKKELEEDNKNKLIK